MAELNRYRVLRQHEGDRMYQEGDTRVARSDDVKHLVGKVLELLGPESPEASVKSEAEPIANRAVPASPSNKADAAPANKSHRKHDNRD